MKRLLALTLAAALLSGCNPIDRGQCLQSHQVFHPEQDSVLLVPKTDFHGNMHLEQQWVHDDAWTETICDRWEYPQGKPEKDN